VSQHSNKRTCIDNVERETWFKAAYPGATIERVRTPGMPTRYVGRLGDERTATSFELADVIRELDHLGLLPR
jgi:hypothetical protein